MTAYDVIRLYYGSRTAKRSGVPLIQHINEGLNILEKLKASCDVQNAYCLHPMFQNDEDLKFNWPKLTSVCGNTYTAVLVMEYRNQANRWLSDKILRHFDEIIVRGQPSPGPLPDVRLMLIADKVQNYKDFLQYHASSHERALELDTYFKKWFKALEINWKDYV